MSVILIASSSESSNITAWDLSNGSHLTSYKANSSPRNGLCLLGRDYLLAAQSNKDAIQIWTWHKDQAVQRSFTLERSTAVAATQCGTYLAAGGPSGQIYLWEVASGRLLRSWSGHYKGVTCLQFSASGLFLFSGGEDTQAAAWLIVDLLDISQDVQSPSYHRPTPLHSWSDHTLPVTSIAVGLGESSAIVATSSLDRSVRIHRVSDGKLLLAASLPSGLTCMVMDAGEHFIYAGGSDGVIYEVPLVPSTSSASASTSIASKGFKGQTTGGGGGAGSSRGGGAGSSSSLSMQLGMEGSGIGSSFIRMEGHTRTVNSLSLSIDGETMVSGSEDGTACVWDLRSRQAVHVIQNPGKAPISSALVISRPEHLSTGGAGGGGRTGPRRPQPLSPLVKHLGVPGSLKPWEGAPVIVDGSLARKRRKGGSIVRDCGLWREETFALHTNRTVGGQEASASGAREEALAEQVRSLNEELLRSREESKKWETAHSDLTRAVAESTKVKGKR